MDPTHAPTIYPLHCQRPPVEVPPPNRLGRKEQDEIFQEAQLANNLVLGFCFSTSGT
jgi:hypothetical protein